MVVGPNHCSLRGCRLFPVGSLCSSGLRRRTSACYSTQLFSTSVSRALLGDCLDQIQPNDSQLADANGMGSHGSSAVGRLECRM